MVSGVSSVLSGYYTGLSSSGAAASSLLFAQDATSTTDPAIATLDPNVLAAYYAAKAGVGSSSVATAVAKAPTYATSAPTTSALTNAVLGGGAFVDPSSVKLTATTGSPAQSRDYRNLFALYQGLTALQGLAQKAAAAASSGDAALETTFARGLGEVQSFLGGEPFHSLTVADGALTSAAQSTVSIPKASNAYTTGAIYTGGIDDLPAAFQGSVAFTATVASLDGVTRSVQFDLNDLGSEPRTIGNVAAYLNAQLQAGGVSTRFSPVRTPGTAETVTAGGRTLTLGQNADSYALQVTSGPGETVTFSAPSSTPAIYVAQTTGLTAAELNSSGVGGVSTPATADATRQILKFDGAPGTTDAAPTATQTLAPSIAGVQAQVTGADGALYVLADLSGASPDGQPIKGASDAALLKYDSAGHLLYARTLGAAETASGSALALSADGTQVAVVGSVTGPLSGAVSSSVASSTSTASGAPQGFVSVYDTSQGQELWTQVTGAGASSTAGSAAFAADGTLYVSGDAVASPGETYPGVQQGYLQSFKATPVTAFDGSTTESVVASDVVATGAAPGDKSAGLVVTTDGAVVAATTEQGDLVLRRYEGPLATGVAPSAVRNLGDLGGGSVAGVALAADGSVVVAGSTGSGDLAPGAATNAFAGGQQAFVATVAADLAPAAIDRVTYLDTGAASATATALSVSGNDVYVAGSSVGAPTPASQGQSARTGFVTAVDTSSGQVEWSNTFRGADDQAAPSAIAVAATGSSVLDRLGLPQGSLASPPTLDLVADTSVRPGDQFSVRSGAGAARAVTISANDTLSTLAAKINAALGYAGSATVVAAKSGGSQLKIVSTTTNSIAIEPGPVGADALPALGLTAGLVTAASSAIPAKTAPTSFALKLSASLDISTVANATAAQSVLKAALASIQTAYADLGSPPKTTASAKATGTVPAYISAQIADYQLALSRLTGTS